VPTRLSRWTMSYFAFALAGLLAAELALAAGLFDPLVPESPTSLVVVHLTVLGSLLPLVFGALNQFAPVLSARPLASEALSLATLVLLGPGVAGLVAGFALLAAGAGAGPWLPGGGLLVVTAVALEAGNVLATLLARRPLPFPARFVAAALVFAVLTVLLGLTMALVLAGVPLLPPGLAARALALLPLHLAAGLFGFFGLTAVGVGYKLLPMFSLAPEERGVLGEVVFFAEVGGVAVGFGWPFSGSSSTSSTWRGSSATAGGATSSSTCVSPPWRSPPSA
jgi:hypothetical protein